MPQQSLLLPFIHEHKEQAWGSQACQTSTLITGWCQIEPDCCVIFLATMLVAKLYNYNSNNLFPSCDARGDNDWNLFRDSSASLPLTSTRLIWLTCLSRCPLFSKQRVDKHLHCRQFFISKIRGMLGIEPGTAGSALASESQIKGKHGFIKGFDSTKT